LAILTRALADFDKSVALNADYALGDAHRAWVLAAKNKHDEASPNMTKRSASSRAFPKDLTTAATR
jgi:hypothetical protein